MEKELGSARHRGEQGRRLWYRGYERTGQFQELWLHLWHGYPQCPVSAALPVDLSYTMEDFDIFSTMIKYEYALAVPASMGVSNLDEFFAWAKENQPDGIKGAGAGYPHPLAMGDLCELAGQNFTWVPTDGTAETVQNLLGGPCVFGLLHCRRPAPLCRERRADRHCQHL